MPLITTDVHATTGKTGFVTHITAANNRLTADESVEDGGTDQGFSPFQLLLASLGSCTNITLRMYADRKGWDLQEINITLQLEDVPAELGKNTRIYRHLSFTGNLTAEQKDRLLYVANACPVHKILTGNIAVETVVAGE